MAGASTIPVHFVGEVQDFLLTQPRAGFVQAAGQVLNNADVDYPEAWAEATKADPSLLMCTAEERATMIAARDAASPYKVGGVPYWTVDTANKTLTVPDLRTDFARAGDTKAGNWHGDAIRQLKVDSILYEFRGGGSYTLNSGNVQVEANINIPIIGSPTALENRPRAYSVLRCVCVNPSLASRLEPTSTSNGLVYAVDESKDYSDPLNQRPNVFTTPAQASNAGMPSNRYYDIFDSSITAIADGFAIFRLNGSGTIPAHTRFVITTNSSYAETGGINGYTAISRLLPKGMTMKLSVLTDPSATIRFFYAQGAYVDGMPQDNPKYPTY
jgi:hypothetical protein